MLKILLWRWMKWRTFTGSSRQTKQEGTLIFGNLQRCRPVSYTSHEKYDTLHLIEFFFKYIFKIIFKK